MAIPEGYSLLARVGFVDRGNYSESATYLAGDVVYYNGSTWSALKDNLKGVTPTNGANWRYMARGFASEVLSAITAKDTSGLVGTAGASVGAQELMDAIADKVATKLLLKTDLVSQIVNDATKAASMAALYAVKQQVDQQNSDLTAAKDDIAKKASTNAVTVLENRLPAGFGFVYKSFVVPKQENESTIFDIYSFVPREARWAVVCQTNGTNVPEVTSTFKGVDDHWKITTRQATTGLFTVSVLFIMPI